MMHAPQPIQAGHYDRDLIRLAGLAVKSVQLFESGTLPLHVAKAYATTNRRDFIAIDKPSLCIATELHEPVQLLVRAFEHVVETQGRKRASWSAVARALIGLVEQKRLEIELPGEN